VSGVGVRSSLTLYVSRQTSLRRGDARNVPNLVARPPQPPPPLVLLALLLVALPRSSNEPETEMLANDDRRRGDRYDKLTSQSPVKKIPPARRERVNIIHNFKQQTIEMRGRV